MSKFPRTVVGGVSLPRLLCGSNWFLGYSHTSRAKDRLIHDLFDTPSKIASILEVFLRHGCDAVMAPANQMLVDAIDEAEQRVGERMIYICTPGYRDGRPDSWKAVVDEARQMKATLCFPHQSVTDPRIDRVNRRLMPELVEHLRYIRQAGMVPGLSTHTPEAIICADASGADVETYVQPYNAVGFLCQVETDWVRAVIHGAKKPVMVIKPLGVNRLLPPTGLSFVWNTIRDCDMVTIGTMSTYEAEEDIELSLAILERRKADVELQYTRSKQSIAPKG
jgi:hypothetical protein